jgi:hypothetical protein
MWEQTLGYSMCKDQCHVGRMHFCNVSNNEIVEAIMINGTFIFHLFFSFFFTNYLEKKCAIICHHKELRLTSKGFILILNVNNFDRRTSYLQCFIAYCLYLLANVPVHNMHTPIHILFTLNLPCH